MTGQPESGPGAAVHVAVVNLARATDRRARMREQLAIAGITAAFPPAVDAREPDNAALLDAQPDYGPWGAVGQHDKACTQSHLALLRGFLDTGKPYCLCLEDDVFLSPELGDWLADMSWWPADADIVRLERWRDDKLLLIMDRTRQAHLGRAIARLHSRHSGGAGYIVTRAAAEKILAARPVNLVIDHLLFNVNVSPLARSLTIYQVVPALVVQGNEPEAPANSTRAQTTKPPEARLAKKLSRGWHEAKVMPRLAGLWLGGRATAETITYEARTAPASSPHDGATGPAGRADQSGPAARTQPAPQETG